jgi:hypothetical protein
MVRRLRVRTGTKNDDYVIAGSRPNSGRFSLLSAGLLPLGSGLIHNMRSTRCNEESRSRS